MEHGPWALVLSDEKEGILNLWQRVEAHKSVGLWTSVFNWWRYNERMCFSCLKSQMKRVGSKRGGKGVGRPEQKGNCLCPRKHSGAQPVPISPRPNVISCEWKMVFLEEMAYAGGKSLVCSEVLILSESKKHSRISWNSNQSRGTEQRILLTKCGTNIFPFKKRN